MIYDILKIDFILKITYDILKIDIDTYPDILYRDIYH